MRTVFCVLGFGLLLALTPLAAQDPGNDFRALAEQRLATLDAPELPGIAYALVEGGEVTELGATGVRRLGSDAPVTPRTPFVIGSISKSFTALAVMQLVEAGRLSLDDPIARHLPAFADGPAGTITIRQLLSHTSGYSTYQGLASGRDTTAEGGVIARRAAQLAAQGPAHAPGTQWAYSNANYQVLGRLVEVLGGQPFPAYVETHILQPIGMDDSFVSDGEAHAGMATGHRPWFGGHRPVADGVTDLGTAPQGGVVASASDLARYMRVMMNGRSDVVSARAKAEMMRPAGDASPFYGYGWFIDANRGTAWHSGSSPGVETLMTLVPGENAGVVVLVNAGSGIGFGETAPVRDGITADALGFEGGGGGGRWGRKALFVSMAVLPLVYLASMLWAWRHREALRAKSGAFGQFSLWFPLLTTLAAAWVLLWLVPRVFGVPLETLRAFQPDFTLAMMASAVAGVLWAVARLGIAYTGRPGRGAPSPGPGTG